MNVAERILDWGMENVMPWFLIVMLALVLIGLPVLYWIDARSEHISIKKSDWECKRSHVETHGVVVSGNVGVPLNSKVCDLYERKP